MTNHSELSPLPPPTLAVLPHHTIPELPLEGDCLFIDNSMLELFTSCDRALEYNRIHRRILAEDKMALSFGSATHLALEYRYQVWQNKQPDLLCDDAQGQILTQYFNLHPCTLGDHRTLNFAIEVQKEYNNKFSLEEFQLLKYNEPVVCAHCKGAGFVTATTGQPIPNEPKEQDVISCLFCEGSGKVSTMVELPFSFHLCTLPHPHTGAPIRIMYCGRIDLPVMWNDRLTIIDHKTTSLLGPSFFEAAQMSSQQKGYCFAFQHLTGQQVKQYCINALRVRPEPKKVTDGSKAARAQWWDENLQRQRYDVTQQQLDEWLHNTISLVEQLFFNYKRGHFPMKTSWCAKFGKCAYFDVCNLPMEQRMEMLSSGLFMDNKWSPLNS